MYLVQVAEHVLFDLPGVLFRRSLDEVRRHHVRKFDLVMANHTLSELCNDKERQQAVCTGVCARGSNQWERRSGACFARRATHLRFEVGLAAAYT